MAPTKPKASPAPAVVSDNRKTIDALWLFEQFMHCDPPMVFNVSGIAEATGMKPNTIVKRINTMQHRYPGFGIVTTTKGTRQPSNIAVGSPEIGSNTPAKKPATKANKGKTTNKSVESAESDEEEEEDSRRKTRARSRVEQAQAENEDEGGQSRRETQGSTVDNVASQKKANRVNETSQKLTSRKGKVTPENPRESDSEEHASDNDIRHEDGGAGSQKKALPPTPKTRAGRKSAGLEAIKNVLRSPETAAPRGRHALPREDEGAKQQGGLTNKGANIEDVSDHGLRRIPAALNLSTKRKRSISPDGSSLPLTPLPNILKRFDVTQDAGKHMKEAGHAYVPQPPDMRPPMKKSKPNDADSTEIATSAADQVTQDTISATQEDSEAPLEIVENNELAGTKDGQSQPAMTEGVVTDVPSTARSDHVDHENMTTDPERPVTDETPANDTGDSSDEPGGDGHPAIRLLWTPSGARESTAMWMTRTDQKFPETTRDGAAGEESKATIETEDDSDPNFLTVNQGALSEHAIPTGKSEDVLNETVVTEDREDANDESDEETEQPEQPEKKTIFSRPLEWMIWNPAAKPAKTASGS